MTKEKEDHTRGNSLSEVLEREARALRDIYTVKEEEGGEEAA